MGCLDLKNNCTLSCVVVLCATRITHVFVLHYLNERARVPSTPANTVVWVAETVGCRVHVKPCVYLALLPQYSLSTLILG
jgi:hypothetical protein